MEIAAVTVDAFYELSETVDGTRSELVKGRRVASPLPTLDCGEIHSNVGYRIWAFCKSLRLGRVCSASGVVTDFGEHTVRVPAVSYYSKERLPLEKRVVKYNDLPPDLCVEVVSPSNTKKELRTKIQEYFTVGVRMVWVVEPEDRSITVLTSPSEGRTLYDDSELGGGEVLPGFKCKVSELFE